MEKSHFQWTNFWGAGHSLLRVACVGVLFFVLCGSNAFGSVGGSQVCGAGTATLWQNLSGATITFDLSVSVGQASTVTLSWTDSKGHAQTLTLGNLQSGGVSTSLPAGGAVTYSCTGGFTWQLERAPLLASAGVELQGTFFAWPGDSAVAICASRCCLIEMVG